QSQTHRNPGKGERTTKGTMRITKRHKRLRKASFVPFGLVLCLLCTGPRFAKAAEHRVVGLTSSGMRIEAAVVSSPSSSVPTVMLVGGLGGNDESARLVEQEVRRWEALSQGRRFQLIAIALANPSVEQLQFPPTGVAYRENVVSHVLWRWIGIHAPDLV